MQEKKIIKKLPDTWPTDSRTKRWDWQGKIVIFHPEREPMQSDDGVTWSNVEEPKRA